MFHDRVECFGGPVRCVGAIEEGEDVASTSLQGLAEGARVCESVWDICLDRVNGRCHDLFPFVGVMGLVGVDDALVGLPGGLERGVALVAEDVQQPEPLLGVEELGAGAGEATDIVERVCGASSVIEGVLLETLPALVELISGQGDDMEGEPPWVSFRGQDATGAESWS